MQGWRWDRRTKVKAVAGVLCLGLTIGTAFLLQLSMERALLLAPMLVAGSAVILGLFLVLGRALVDAIREADHPRRIVAMGLGVVLLVVILTAVGIELPRE